MAVIDPREGIKAKLSELIETDAGDIRPAYTLPSARRAITRNDPLAFAVLYLGHHLKSKEPGAPITLSEVHLAWAELAKRWVEPVLEPYQDRHAEIAPRDIGKSTWWFLLLPMWAAAHGHVRFAAAFANTPEQAETHLASFKAELDGNALLRADYPDLVAPRTRGRGTVEADRVSLYHARSGFVFAAAGMDSANLGLKVGSQRPDLIILDDIEPHEARYSAKLMTKRLDTLRSAILPLNIYAHVIAVGTVTMAGSIIHQLVEAAKKEGSPADWVVEEKFAAHHYPAIATNDDGTRRSVWAAKWSLEFLESIEHTRTYAKNYANDPMGADGDYWTSADFIRGDLEGVTRTVLSIDPNVTQKESSDYTGLAVVGWAPSTNKCRVSYAAQIKQDLTTLRLTTLALIEEYDVGLVIIETNQGGDLWLKILWGLPVKVKPITQSIKKEVRAATALHHYQRKRVIHAPGLTSLEGQQVAFPNAPNDDMVDAVGTALLYFLQKPKSKVKVSASTDAYAT